MRINFIISMIIIIVLMALIVFINGIIVGIVVAALVVIISYKVILGIQLSAALARTYFHLFASF